jgi:hypothetical protein
LLAKIEERLRKHKYITVSVAASLANFWVLICNYALAHDNTVVQVVADFLYPFFTIMSFHYFIEEDSFEGRVKIAIYEAFGYAVGAWIFCEYVREYIK